MISEFWISPARPMDGRSMCSMIGSLNVNTRLEILNTTSSLSHWLITRRWSWAKDRKWPKTPLLTCGVRCIKQSQFNTTQAFDTDHSMPIVLISLSVGGRRRLSRLSLVFERVRYFFFEEQGWCKRLITIDWGSFAAVTRNKNESSSNDLWSNLICNTSVSQQSRTSIGPCPSPADCLEGGHWAFSQTLESVRMQFHQADQLEGEKSFDADVIDWKTHSNDGALSITRLSCSTARIDSLDEQRSLSGCSWPIECILMSVRLFTETVRARMTDLSDDLNLFQLFVRIKSMVSYSKSSLINPFHSFFNSARLSNSCNVTTNDHNGLFEIVFASEDAAEAKEWRDTFHRSEREGRSLLNRIHWETTRIMARTNRFRAEDQLSALLVENWLTNDRNLCQLFDEQVKRKPKSALEQCTSLFEFSSFFIEMNSYRVWHSRLGSTERPTRASFSHRATATRMVNVDFHSIGPSTVSLNSLVSVFSLSEESSSVGERGAGFGGRFALMITKKKYNTIFGKTLLVHIVRKRVCYSCTFHGRKAKSYNDVLARSRAADEHLHSSSRATANRTPTTVTERNFVH